MDEDEKVTPASAIAYGFDAWLMWENDGGSHATWNDTRLEACLAAAAEAIAGEVDTQFASDVLEYVGLHD